MGSNPTWRTNQIGEILKLTQYLKECFIGFLIVLLSSFLANKALAYNPKQIDCIARNVYHESRGEGIKGMLAVAHVTLNRAKSGKFPSTPCGVVFQSNQFSWVRNKPVVRDQEQYSEVKQLVKEVVAGQHKDVTNGATYFHTRSIRPYWSNKMNCTARIGNHVFYKPKGR